MGLAVLAGVSAVPGPTLAQGQAFTPPPRSIADITAVLDSEKPDPAKLARYIAQAEAQPPAGASTSVLARFYRDRSVAAGQLGRTEQWVADAKEALKLADQVGDPNISDDARFQLALAASETGNYVDSIRYARERVETAGRYAGQLAGAHASLASSFAFAGDLAEARDEAAQAQAALERFRGGRGFDRLTYASAERSAAIALGAVFFVEGRFAEAEREVSRAVARSEEVVQGFDNWMNDHKGSREVHLGVLVRFRLRLAQIIAREGRLPEAEAMARRALLESLHQQGRYAPGTAGAVSTLSTIILDEGRPDDALLLARAAVDIYERIGAARGARSSTAARLAVANALAAKGAWREAMAAYDEAGRGIGPQDQSARTLFIGAPLRIVAELKTGRVNDALQQVSAIAAKREQMYGASHPGTLEAEGLKAAALYLAGRREEALAAFRVAVPRLVQSSRGSESDDSAPLLREIVLRFVLETYMDLLSQSRDAAAAAEAFQLADVVRGQTVQRALGQSAARVSVRDPALADLVRKEQDARSQISSLFTLLANVQSAPDGQRDDKVLASLRAEIDRIRGERAKLREEIERRFPDYANLVDPKPAGLDQVRKVLAPDEAVLAFYLGETKSFVWAARASGGAGFASVPLTAIQVAAEVQVLRRALEPNASTLADIPPFDTARAYRLYQAFLAPIETGWRGAKSVLVVTHGALGELPLGLLPTAASPPPGKGELPFAEYKQVPWLLREVAVTELPSATSLVTLRSLPAGNPARRPFVGFGDPWFSEAEAREGQAQPRGGETVIASRGSGRGLHIVLRAAPKTESSASAGLASLPRLPDTAEEVRNVALALKADPGADVFLGAQANEETVRKTDLANRRVVMFATHGLVPGDLDGLQEPALALTAPSVAHVGGDGLLTMSKILGLKLDADWVVLSACNTAAGNGAGAEAISGLGRAFFYAGTRALLVSNWPVETTSARIITTDLFRRQAEQPALTRAEALRQAELALIDGPGFVANGKALFSYAHPIFWAPFTVVGDGGRRSGT